MRTGDRGPRPGRTGRGLAAHPALAVLAYYLVGYRRVWRGTVFSSFVVPVLFFLGMGVAVGEYVDRGGGLELPYLRFLGAGLLAFTAVQIAMLDASFPVLGGFKWVRSYHGMAATPARVSDIVLGLFGYLALRLGLAAGAFLLVMIPFGAVTSAWAAVAPLVAVLVGLAVAAPVTAFSASVRNPNLLTVMFRFGLLPMMLFSGVFFPVDQLPAGLRPVAYALPLWHGVELCRSAAVEVATAWPVPLHLGVLALWLAAGSGLALRRFRRRLVS